MVSEDLFSKEEFYDEEIDIANEQIRSKIGEELEKYGYWEIYAYPSAFKVDRLKDIRDIRNLLERTKAQSGMRSFPYIHRSDGSYSYSINNAFFSHCKYTKTIEALCAFQSGLFTWKKILWEDLEDYESPHGERVIDYLNLIWNVTDFFRFFKRYYEEITLEENLHIEIYLYKCYERVIWSFKSGVRIDEWPCKQEGPVKVKKNIRAIELKANYNRFAIETIK